MNKRNVILTVGLLALTLAPLAAPAAGGDSSGGGSTLGRQLLDRRVRENTIGLTSADMDELAKRNKLFNETMPEYSRSFAEFFMTSTGKRFVLTDKLPEVKETDVKHEVADDLVGLQRGPIVWVKRSYWEQAPAAERAEFYTHEFFVGEKLKAGPLSARDREEVLNVNAAVSEMAEKMADFAQQDKQEKERRSRELQKLLERNHFEAAATNAERDLITGLGDKLTKLFVSACDPKKPSAKSLAKISELMEYVGRRSRDEEASRALRTELAEMKQNYDEAQRHSDGLCEGFRASLNDAKTTLELEPHSGVTFKDPYGENGGKEENSDAR